MLLSYVLVDQIKDTERTATADMRGKDKSLPIIA